MWNHSNQDHEVKRLRNLLGQLAQGIDDRNSMLMQTEEKNAHNCVVLAEKERLLAEKERLLAEEMSKTLHLKLQNEKLMHELESKKTELELRSMEPEESKLQIEHGRVTSPPIIDNVKRCLVSLGMKLEPQYKLLEMSATLNEKEQMGFKAENVKQMMLEGQSVGIKVQDTEAELQNLRKELEEKEEALQFMETLNKTLLVKEQTSNKELHLARLEAIKGLGTMQSTRMTVGIKRMGEVDPKPFYNACSKMFCSEELEEKSAELCSFWQEKVYNSNWHPFKRQTINGKEIEIVDDDDETLKKLRDEWGEEVYKAVADAILDVNEYNPSGGYAVRELWNFKEGRRAALQEVIKYIIKQWQTHKKKKRRF
ncbi:hypothetical protein Dimus_033879 [Dionaea muscipula]